MAKTTKPKAPPPPAMVEMEMQAKKLADARANMARVASNLKDGIKRVTDKHIADLRQCAADVGVEQQALVDLVKQHQTLFTKPRSQAFHGIVIGYQKGKGRYVYEDAEKVIARIEKFYPDEIDVLAPSSRSLSHKAFEGADGETLKKIGVSLKDNDDKPYVKAPADDIDKFAASVVSAYTTAGQEQTS